MTLDTTLAEYIYDHIKRCLGGSEGGQMNDKIIKRGEEIKKKGKGEDKKYKDKITFHGYQVLENMATAPRF